MQNRFFEQPILNSPYEYPTQYWELDPDGQPTHQILDGRRSAEFITPIPKPKLTKVTAQQARLELNNGSGLSDEDQLYDVSASVNEIRSRVDAWRRLPSPNNWGVTPETARLLQHWRSHQFSSYRPFFCQIEAIETLIWLTEVAPRMGPQGRSILQRLNSANKEANPELLRIALKLATGAGKTTVMAMIIAWQTINAVRRPQSENFTRGFLVVAPGITIRDRLRVLQPNDPDSYYNSRELVPADMLEDLKRAKIVITNYHAFMLRERMKLSKVGRGLLEGREGQLKTQETEGQMIQRVMPDLMNLKNILVMNDEAHHCYQEKPGEEDEANLKGEDKQEAKKNNEAARVWITGLETIKRKVGISQVIDLSATPFFLRGSGYREGTLFPWTVSDFSLMDAIECGIVKLPRVPVADNIPDGKAPMYRFLWDEIRPDMPKKGRGKSTGLDPQNLPLQLQTALEALYGHYEQTYQLWNDAEIPVPPCFVIVCNNTATSKLVFDYVSGFNRQNEDGSTSFVQGKLDLFRNFDEHGNRLHRPNTVLIDSQQLESGEALDTNFRKMAAQEIEQYRREIIERTGDRSLADNISDQDLLREVMNTVGTEGRLGGSIRCVVSVSMLTEGWDANTVTHILGVRAFGTQLLCEQVVGRALRRYSYEQNEKGLFDVEYADVFGVPFDFTARPVVVQPHKPPPTVQVIAVRPERDHLEIRFPRVAGYRVDLPKEQLTAEFNDDSILELTPDLIGPSHTTNAGIIGESVDLNLGHTKDLRRSTLLFHLTKHLINTKWRDAGAAAELHLFGRLKRITNQWLNQCLVCKGDAYPAQLMFVPLAEMACDRIAAAITRTNLEGNIIKALLDPYNPVGSTRFLNFRTSKALRWKTDPSKCHVNWVILDSNWEGEFCRVAEEHPRVRAYVKNHSLGFTVPYKHGSANRLYVPDFIVQVDDGRGPDDPLNLVVEIKGYRGEDAKEKKTTMETYWVPGVNAAGEFGRWKFAEFTDVYEIGTDFAAGVEAEFNSTIANNVGL